MNRLVSLRGIASTVGAAAFVAAATTAAVAATATSSFQVSANVQALCTIGANNLDFGTYLGPVREATSTITVTCTNTTLYNVGLSAGNGIAASVTERTMANGVNTLDYQLFRDPARLLNWGTTVGTDTLPGVGVGTSQTLTVYGRIPAGQFVTPGAYSDTITATITY